MIDSSLPGRKSGFPYQCFFKFRITSQERYQLLFRTFNVLKEEKKKLLERLEKDSEVENDDQREYQVEEDRQRRKKIEEEIFDLLDEQTLLHFWWPSQQEKEDYWRRWKTIPREQRDTDPTLKVPWDFSSMIDSILTGEYELLSCQLLTPDRGVLIFLPYSLPYGSSDALQALIEAFDCEVIGVERGTGYISYG